MWRRAAQPQPGGKPRREPVWWPSRWPPLRTHIPAPHPATPPHLVAPISLRNTRFLRSARQRHRVRLSTYLRAALTGRRGHSSGQRTARAPRPRRSQRRAAISLLAYQTASRRYCLRRHQVRSRASQCLPRRALEKSPQKPRGLPWQKRRGRLPRERLQRFSCGPVVPVSLWSCNLLSFRCP